MKIIGLNDIAALNIPKASYYNWAKETFLAKSDCVLPAKTSMKWYAGEGFVNVMPSIIPSLGVYGVKTVTRNPDAIPTLKSAMMLFDIKSSELLAVLDADYITAFRTGGTATLAIETLAVKNYKTIGLIGLGNICRAVVLVLLSVVKDRELTFKLHLFENTDNGLIALLKQFPNVKIETYSDIESVVRDSDVVVSCVTFTDKDLTQPEWFKKGALLVPIHTRGFMNCDEQFDRVVYDDYDHVKHFKDFELFKNKHELAEVLKNPSCGRQNNEERIIAYNIGISLLDIYFSKKIYDMFPDKEEFSLEPELERYWVK